MTQEKAIYQGQRIFLEEKYALDDLETLIGKPVPAVEFINTFVYGFIAINDCVISLGIPNKGLVVLPESIGKLSSVQDIQLFSNQLKTLPESFGDLKSLRLLNLVNNKLETLPEFFTQQKSLQNLFLNRNKLDILPESFGRLKALQTLNVRNNQLKTLPESILELPNLEMLFVRNNPLDDAAMRLLKHLKEQGVNIDIDHKSEQVLKKIRDSIPMETKRSD
ncbi:MAG: leucine-rich repeat domain-containing protein [Promethearchaeota archaeon]